MNCAQWQHKLSREGGSSLDCASELRACRYTGTIESICSSAPYPFLPLLGTQRHALGWGQPPSHAQVQYMHGTVQTRSTLLLLVLVPGALSCCCAVAFSAGVASVCPSSAVFRCWRLNIFYSSGVSVAPVTPLPALTCHQFISS